MLLIFIVLFAGTTASVYAEDDEDLSGSMLDLIDDNAPIGEYIIGLFKDVFAEDYEPYKYMTEPKDDSENQEGGVILEIKRFPLERYMVNNEDTSGIFGINLYSINNMLMGVIHNIVEVTDSALQMFTLDRLDSFANDIESVSSDIYTVLKSHFAEMLFILLCTYLLFIYFVHGNFKETLKKFFTFVLVLIVAGYWVSNASFLMKTMNSLSGELQSSLVSAGSGILNIMDSEREGVYADVNNIDGDNKIDGTIAVIRNIYFDLALKKPYYLINYGTSNEKKINEKDKIKKLGFGFDKYDRTDRMLAFNLSSNGTAYRMAHANLEVEKNNNTNIASGSAFRQSGLVFITLFIVIGLSIPFLLIGLLNFILQLLAILLALVLPFAFIISYIPNFAMTGFKALGNILTVFLAKGLLGILLFVLYLLAYSMYILITPNSTGMYLLHVVSLIIILFFAILKRNKIISVITAGRVRSLSSAIPSMNNFYGKQYSNAKNRIENKKTNKRESPMNERSPQDNPQDLNKKNRSSMNENKDNVVAKKSIFNRTPQQKNVRPMDEKRNAEVNVKNKLEEKNISPSNNHNDENKVENNVAKSNVTPIKNNQNSTNEVSNYERSKQVDNEKARREFDKVNKDSNTRTTYMDKINNSKKRDELENDFITKTTGVSGSKLKDFEVEIEKVVKNDPISKKLRKSVGTDYENKGYGLHKKDGRKINSVEESKNNRNS